MHTYCYDKDPFLAGSGISIEKQMTLAEGRVLNPPTVKLFMIFFVHRKVCSSDLFNIFTPMLFCLYILQLKFGKNEDFLPSNGRWNFNKKVDVC